MGDEGLNGTIMGGIIFAATLALVISRPRGLPEWLASLGGALAMLLTGIVSPRVALELLHDNANVFGFFLGLMTVSAVAESAGFFDTLARLAVRLSGSSAKRLMLNVMLIGTLITTFLTNDATALILTPVVYALVVGLRLEPLPFMFACTFIADTASFVLPVSNPINVLFLTTFPYSLGQYLARLLLAALVVITANIALFLRIFRHDLEQPFDLALLGKLQRSSRDRYFWYVTGSLAALALAYVFASAWRWPLSVVALGGGGWLLMGGLVSHRMDWRRLGGEISWSIFGFIAGMLVTVRGVENLGVTQTFGRWLVRLAGGHPAGVVAASVFGSALGANAINNVSAALVLISAIRVAAPPGPLRDILVFGSILGADLGPNITTVGSLATILWLLILRRKGLEVSSIAYFRLGIAVTPVLLVLGALSLWLSTFW